MDRRNFLITSFASLSALSWSCARLSHLPSRTLTVSGFTRSKTSGSSLLFQDLSGNVQREIPVPVAAHAIYKHPNKRDEFLFFPQAGTVAGIGQLLESKTPAYFNATKDFHFYGHGQYNVDGSCFYSVETRNFKGKIVVRDSTSLKVLDEWHLPMNGAHDCILIEEEKLLAVAMDGISRKNDVKSCSESCLVFLSTENGKIVSTMPTPTGLALGHVTMAPENQIIGGMSVFGKNRCSVSLGKRGQVFRELEVPDSITKATREHCLSVAVNFQTMMAGAVFPMGNLAVFWSLPEGKFICSVPFSDPRGISAFGENFIVTSRGGQRILDKNLRASPEVEMSPDSSYLSHHLTFTG